MPPAGTLPTIPIPSLEKKPEEEGNGVSTSLFAGFETSDKLFVPEDRLRSSLSLSLPLCLLTPLKRRFSRLSHSNVLVI